MQSGLRNIDATQYLTSVVPMLHKGTDMARAGDVVKRIHVAAVTDGKRLREISSEMSRLAEAHNRYLALQREYRVHEYSARALAALLGPQGWVHVMKTDASDTIGEEIDAFPSPRELRDNTALPAPRSASGGDGSA